MKLDSLVESGTKDLGLRFNLVGMLPSVVLFLFLLALYWSGAPGRAPDLRLVIDRIEAAETKEGILLALGTLTFSLLLQPLQGSLVSMLEGYWSVPLIPRAGDLLRWPGIKWHGYRRRKLREQTETTKPLAEITAEDKMRIGAADWKLRRYYPALPRLLPTALGNALRASEDVPYKKYKLDGVVVWPRLFPLLPENMTSILADRRNQLDMAARFSAIFLLCAVISALLLYRHRWWLLTPATALLLAWLSYKGAVAAAVAYGESIQAAFDLYRSELYKALRIPLPLNLTAERKTNKLISDFFRQGLDKEFQSIQYEPASPKTEDKPALSRSAARNSRSVLRVFRLSRGGGRGFGGGRVAP